MQMVEVDYDLLKLLFPVLVPRIHKFAEDTVEELNTEPVVRELVARIVQGDQSIKVLVGIENNQLKAHAVIGIQAAVINIQQCQVDKGVKGFAENVMEYCKALAKQLGVEYIGMVTTRNDKAFEKKYKFTTKRHVMLYKIEEE